MKKDPEGHEYQMEVEMLRDKAKWYLGMAGLTGDSFFLNQAVKYFNQAINEAKMGSSGWTVAVMEREIAQRQQGKK